MAQAGYTPIQLYLSTTASAVPSAGNLANGELAINITDGKLFYKDNGGVVRVLAGTGGTGVVAGSNTQLQFNNNGVFGASSGLTWDGTNLTASQLRSSGLTSGRVTYAGASGQLVDSANLLYSGTDLTVYGLTVGRGAGAVSTNTAVGASALAANTTGSLNSAFGFNALATNTTGYWNTAIGRASLSSNTTGTDNTAVGVNALANSTTGNDNVAVGLFALQVNTTGSANTGVGTSALTSNTTADNNTAIGYQAAYTNSTGAQVTAVGRRALYSNTTGSFNNALGESALYANTTGQYNTAVGGYALLSSTTVSGGTAVGYQAGYSNTTGTEFVALGYQAGYSNSTGTVLTALGYQALYSTNGATQNVGVGHRAGYAVTTGSYNTTVGVNSLRFTTTGGNNTALGGDALFSNTTASNNVAVGYQALYSNTTAGNSTALGTSAAYSNTTGVITAIGRNAGYANTTGIGITAIGENAGLGANTTNYSTYVGATSGYNGGQGANNTFVGFATGYNSTGSRNTFVGARNGASGCGQYMTTGNANTILGGFDGNQGLDIRAASNYIVLSDGDGNPRGIFDGNGNWLVGGTASPGQHLIAGRTATDGTLFLSLMGTTAAQCAYFYYVNSGDPNAANAAMKVWQNTTTLRSINAKGTINASGADYAEYMTKASAFNAAKGDVLGVDANGKLTNVFADAVSFVVKSTNPSYVGGDTWGDEDAIGKRPDENAPQSEKDAFNAKLEVARQTVDRIAFAGQVPVNVVGATAGQYIVPVNDNGAIKGVAKTEADLTLSDYIKAVGKVIAIEADGRAKIIVKVA